MMGIGLIVVAAFVFYRIAVIEQLKPGVWATASVGVSIVSRMFGGQFTMLFGQPCLASCGGTT